MTTRTHFLRQASLVALLVFALAAMGVVGMAGRANAASRYATGLLQAPEAAGAISQDSGARPRGPRAVSAQGCCACDAVKSTGAEAPMNPRKLARCIPARVFSDLLDLPPPGAPPRS